MPVGLVALVGAVVAARGLRTLPSVEAFIARYPGTGSFAAPVDDGFPWWLRYQHYFNFFLMAFMVRSGLQILADHPRLYIDPHCTPGREWFRLRGPVPRNRSWTSLQDAVALPTWLGLPGRRHSIGLARWWHASFDLLWLVNGILFFVLLFSTDQWMRLVPRSWDVVPNAASTAVQYLSLDFPPRSGWLQYNALQILAYFTTVFIAAPLAIVTGLLQSPAVAARFGTALGPLNRQVARTVHFAVLCYFVVFLAIHATMVASTGVVRNLNHITDGTNGDSLKGLVLFLAGMVIVTVAWIAASPLTWKYPRLVQHAGRFLTGRLNGLFEHLHPRSEFRPGDVSPYFWANGTPPASEVYRAYLAEGFRNFSLTVGGLVEHPLELSFAELTAMPKVEQITQHYCIQGWSGIARWGGVRIADILERAGPMPEARYIVFTAFGDGADGGGEPYYDVHELALMADAASILAYEMNGELLPELHGAPLRVRNEIELGFKQVKWVRSLELVASFGSLGAGEGGYQEDHEFFGYRAPI